MHERGEALQVTKSAVVAEDVKAVGGALEGAARFVMAVAAGADVGAQHVGALFGRHASCEFEKLGVGEAGRGVECDGERDFLDGSGELRGGGGGGPPRLRQVVRPDPAAVGQVDAAQERRDDLAQLDEHVSDLARLGQRVGAQAQQQRFVGLAGAVDPDVGAGRCGEQAAQQAEVQQWGGAEVSGYCN